MDKEKNPVELIERIKLMEQRCGSPAALASLLGVKEVTVRSWKNQTYKMPEMAIKLLEYLEKENVEQKAPPSELKRIRAMEEKLGGSEEFAKEMGISRVTLRSWKNGTRRIPETAIKLLTFMELKYFSQDIK